MWSHAKANSPRLGGRDSVCDSYAIPFVRCITKKKTQCYLVVNRVVDLKISPDLMKVWHLNAATWGSEMGVGSMWKPWFEMLAMVVGKGRLSGDRVARVNMAGMERPKWWSANWGWVGSPRVYDSSLPTLRGLTGREYDLGLGFGVPLACLRRVLADEAS